MKAKIICRRYVSYPFVAWNETCRNKVVTWKLCCYIGNNLRSFEWFQIIPNDTHLCKYTKDNASNDFIHYLKVKKSAILSTCLLSNHSHTTSKSTSTSISISMSKSNQISGICTRHLSEGPLEIEPNKISASIF